MTQQSERIMLITHDYEADIGSWTRNYTGVEKATKPLIEIHAKHDVPATVYFTAEAAKHHAWAVEAWRDAGHQIGCHGLQHESYGPHHWEMAIMEPLLEHEIRPRIELATEIVEKVAGVRPRTFRCPRGFCGNAVLSALEDLGYVTDSSYMMFHYEKQLAPYHPSAEDWTQQGDMQILEIPFFADVTVKEKSRERDQWPVLRTEGAEALMKKIERMDPVIADAGLPLVCCIYLHPWEFAPMPHVYHGGEAKIEFVEFLWKNTGDVALHEFNRFLALAKDKGFVFRRASELAERGRF